MGNIPKDVVATFSIVGFDQKTGELGVAVQSKFIGVGSVVPWAKAGVGAVATQSFANTSYGPKGLSFLEEGLSVDEVVKRLTENDPDRDQRQFGIVDAKGHAATYTGEKCFDWAGGITGSNYAAQGNILVNEETVTEMGRTFEEMEGCLAERLLTALDAGQAAGGDSRGKQSAALYIVKEQGGYGGFNDRYIDLRVDDHPEPIKELIRLYKLRELYFGETKEDNIIKIEGNVLKTLTAELRRLEYLSEDNPSEGNLYEAFTAFLHTENFEERELDKGEIDKEVLDFMVQFKK